MNLIKVLSIHNSGFFKNILAELDDSTSLVNLALNCVCLSTLFWSELGTRLDRLKGLYSSLSVVFARPTELYISLAYGDI